MKKNIIVSLFCVGLLCVSLTSVSQKPPVKFGKIDKSILEMKVYDKDTSARAVVLCDFGNSYFVHNQKVGFQYYYEAFMRIKILKQSGLDVADKVISTLNNIYGKEKVLSLKGYTHNIENGKVESVKLSNTDKFIEKTTDNFTQLKFTMPNVKVGSVIEYKYVIASDFISRLKNWNFQSDIPVVYSEYNTAIPEYFNFHKTFLGYHKLDVNESREIIDKMTYIYERWNENRVKIKDQHEVEYFTTIEKFAMKDIPAFKEEAYMTSRSNYLSAMKYELSYVQYPSRKRKSYSKSWDDINRVLLEDDDFGKQLSGNLLVGGTSFIDEDVELILKKSDKPIEKMNLAFEHIKSHMKWNRRNGVQTESNLKKAYANQSGNIADVNLMLIVLLRKLGIESYPVALSTRENGIIHPSHPALDKLNYIIVLAIIDGKNYMLDASIPYYAVNFIPYKCLNGQGFIIDAQNSKAIQLYNQNAKSSMIMNELSIDVNGNLTGTVQKSLRNYAAFEHRKDIGESVSVKSYIESLEKNMNGLKINKHSIENLKDLNKPLILKYDVEIEEHVMAIGDMMYFNPMLDYQFKETPFKLENRNYPVDYGYKINEYVINKFIIPEGFVIEELPENISLSMEGNSARLTYNITQIGNTIQVMSKFLINKTVFLPEEYLALKNFYNQVINKHAQQIVLKKASL